MSNARRRLGNSYNDFLKVRDDLYKQIDNVFRKTSGQSSSIIAGGALNKIVNTLDLDIAGLTLEVSPPATSFLVIENSSGGTLNKITVSSLTSSVVDDSEAFAFFMS